MTGPGTRLPVSVIIPARNEAAIIGATVRSAREAGADEVIVVDGESRDGTPDAARPVADAVILSPPGRARQMNAGATAAKGEILLFLHADTSMANGSIAAIREAMAREDVLGGAFSVRLKIPADAPSLRKAALRLVSRMINLRARLLRAYTGDQAIFLRRAVFEEIGAYPEIPLMEDVELSRRLTRRGRTVLLPVPVTTSARRWEEHGTLRTILLMWGLRLAYLLGMPPARCADLYGRRPKG
jgi:rSAM/selenodomain-associated transferase 2